MKSAHVLRISSAPSGFTLGRMEKGSGGGWFARASTGLWVRRKRSIVGGVLMPDDSPMP